MMSEFHLLSFLAGAVFIFWMLVTVIIVAVLLLEPEVSDDDA